ncbi:MAG: energy transducer TonB [Rhodopseudomonas sp.]|uniref:energy transducer TonB n=1 Tax=Rhodopseudomonas sp. TaxID=1078 RepID=UPI0017EC03ED|nr:energy transducer TonB [Rhodopseudomonas sp.]NVN85042.1 energy transducer TonB [Rhodopseudomonas sp.]
MNAFALHRPTDQAGVTHWAASAIVIVAAHLGLIAAGLAWYQQTPPPGVAIPAIMVDLAPAASAPAAQLLDAAPGPEMQQATAATPEPAPQHQQPVERKIEPVPPQPKPEVELPPERKAEPAPAKPEPVKKIERDSPKLVTQPKPQPLHVEASHASAQPPAPRTSAPPKAERRAAMASLATAGVAAAAALPSYRDQLAAHLQRFKQYPSGAKSAGEQGTAMLSFTVGRSGQVLGSRLAGSSGHPALDAETLAMIRRAQPLPSFPPELTQSSLSFTVPVRFSLR